MGDININPETFTNALKCITDANDLIEKGLGKISDLDSSSLSKIGIKNISNDEKLKLFNDECYTLESNMISTIKLLSSFDSEMANSFRSLLSERGLEINMENMTLNELTQSVINNQMTVDELSTIIIEMYPSGEISPEDIVTIVNTLKSNNLNYDHRNPPVYTFTFEDLQKIVYPLYSQGMITETDLDYIMNNFHGFNKEVDRDAIEYRYLNPENNELIANPAYDLDGYWFLTIGNSSYEVTETDRQYIRGELGDCPITIYKDYFTGDPIFDKYLEEVCI